MTSPSTVRPRLERQPGFALGYQKRLPLGLDATVSMAEGSL